jgi:hypothetical protein
MDGAAARAFLKTSRMAFSDSPTYLLKTCRGESEMSKSSSTI